VVVCGVAESLYLKIRLEPDPLNTPSAGVTRLALAELKAAASLSTLYEVSPPTPIAAVVTVCPSTAIVNVSPA